jgi:DNA-binding GntR family transcriptional regulator
MSKTQVPVRGKRPKGAGAQSVYERIRGQILRLELAPGSSVDEASLARMHGVSRTPVREALVRLASEGLVQLLPNRGSQIAPLDLARIKDYLEAIDLCQRAVTRWAAVRRRPEQLDTIAQRARDFEEAVRAGDADRMVLTNRDFHAAIADACGNLHLALAYKRLLDEGLRISRFSLSDRYLGPETSGEFIDQVLREHCEMVEYIRRRQPDGAERIALHHTERTRERFLEFLMDTLSPELSVEVSR